MHRCHQGIDWTLRILKPPFSQRYVVYAYVSSFPLKLSLAFSQLERSPRV